MDCECLYSRTFLITSRSRIPPDPSNEFSSTMLSRESVRRNPSMPPKPSLHYPQAYTYVPSPQTAKFEAILVTQHERLKTANFKGQPIPRHIILEANMQCMLDHGYSASGQFWPMRWRGVTRRKTMMQDTRFRKK